MTHDNMQPPDVEEHFDEPREPDQLDQMNEHELRRELRRSLLKLGEALEATESVRREWIADRETTKAERNEARKERDAAVLRLDEIVEQHRLVSNKLADTISQKAKAETDRAQAVAYAEGIAEESMRKWDAAEQRAITAESRLGDGSKRMLELVEKHHEVIAERDSALLRLDSADQAVKLSKVAYRMAEERANAAERERDLAIAHDLQPYPTVEAYEKACAALHAREDEVKTFAELLHSYVEWFDRPAREHGWITPSDDWLRRAREMVVERQKS